MSNSEERLWLQDHFQEGRVQHRFSADERRTLLWQLTAAEGLERYLHTKYVGQKRFSLEGGDALIPLLDDLIQQGGQRGVEEIVIGMAHRGRLNVLVNVLGKSPPVLFSEFEGKYDTAHMQGSGDVKYHKGFSADLRTPGGNVHVALAFNPSHLEVVNPVVEGSVRARQERRGDTKGDKVAAAADPRRRGVRGPGRRHGNAAAVAGARLLHRRHAARRSSTTRSASRPPIRATRARRIYCSDVAKMLEAPIFHVNGDDPEAVVFVTRLALDYRMTFHKDVVIDLVCYRRHGHNEADEPAATQPMMYQAIRNQPTPRQIYADQLVAERRADRRPMRTRWSSSTAAGSTRASRRRKHSLGMIGNKYTVDWSKYHARRLDRARADRRARRAAARARRRKLTTPPANITLHPRVARIVQDREKMAAGELPLDWGSAENAGVRDAARRKAIECASPARTAAAARSSIATRCCTTSNAATTYIPLQHLAPSQPRFQVIDSRAVRRSRARLRVRLLDHRAELRSSIWEGQFGDFVNGAQVIIDQFISSGEAKWGRLCGLTLFLPHGYEGQGPEHSSARLERFLQLCAENNMQVCVPSTPAQMFHMLRRQMLRGFRKPLIVMTPKSLLRHELSVSSLEDLTRGSFRRVIDEVDDVQAGQGDARRVLLRQGLLRPARSRAARDELHERRARARRAALSVPGRRVRGRPRASTRTRAKSSGARKSRRTRARGTRSAIACRSRCRRASSCCTPAARRPRRRRPASRRCTRINSKQLVDAALRATSAEETLRQTSAPSAPTGAQSMTGSK